MSISRIGDFNPSQHTTPTPQGNNGRPHGNCNTGDHISSLVSKIKRFVNGKRGKAKEEFSEKSKKAFEEKQKKPFQFEDLHHDVKHLIFQEAIFNQNGTLCLTDFRSLRLVSKKFKEFVDHVLLKTVINHLKQGQANIPDALGLRQVVQSFLTSLTKGTIKVFQNLKEFSIELFKRTQFHYQEKEKKIPLITSSEQIEQLVENETPLHFVWEKIKPQLLSKTLTDKERQEINDLKTAKEISQWMKNHCEALATIIELDLSILPSDENPKRLMTLPPEIGLLTHLSYLSLSGHRLESLPSEIGELTRLNWLILEGNRLKSLPPEIKNLTNLQILDLSSNQLNEVPPVLGEFVCLSWLKLSFNQIKELPSEFENLVSLESLYLNKNQISDFPSVIKNLNNLSELDLSDNQLTSLPQIIETNKQNLSNLHTFNLSGNLLTDLPPEIISLQSLEAVILSNNRFKEIPSFSNWGRPSNALPLVLFFDNNPLLSSINVSNTNSSLEIITSRNEF